MYTSNYTEFFCEKKNGEKVTLKIIVLQNAPLSHILFFFQEIQMMMWDTQTISCLYSCTKKAVHNPLEITEFVQFFLHIYSFHPCA